MSRRLQLSYSKFAPKLKFLLGVTLVPCVLHCTPPHPRPSPQTSFTSSQLVVGICHQQDFPPIHLISEYGIFHCARKCQIWGLEFEEQGTSDEEKISIIKQEQGWWAEGSSVTQPFVPVLYGVTHAVLSLVRSASSVSGGEECRSACAIRYVPVCKTSDKKVIHYPSWTVTPISIHLCLYWTCKTYTFINQRGVREL